MLSAAVTVFSLTAQVREKFVWASVGLLTRPASDNWSRLASCLLGFQGYRLYYPTRVQICVGSVFSWGGGGRIMGMCVGETDGDRSDGHRWPEKDVGRWSFGKLGPFRRGGRSPHSCYYLLLQIYSWELVSQPLKTKQERKKWSIWERMTSHHGSPSRDIQVLHPPVIPDVTHAHHWVTNGSFHAM